ncbi:MAG TPA: sigma factor [Burkholderiales bacterium]|nr:sigma factor [Burkholderiales bacterium]
MPVGAPPVGTPPVGTPPEAAPVEAPPLGTPPDEVGAAGAEQVAVWELVRRAQGGDAEGFGLLYDRYVDVVFRFLLHRVGDRATAEDFTSETFVRALRRIDSLSFQGRDVGVELGQLLVLIVLIPLLGFVFRRVVPERIGMIILSVLIGHTGWHWMTERAERLAQFPWPQWNAAMLAGAMRWLMALLVLAAAMWAVNIVLRKRGVRLK